MLLDALFPFPLFFFTNVLSAFDFSISHPCIVVNDLLQRDFNDMDAFTFMFLGAFVVGIIMLRYAAPGTKGNGTLLRKDYYNRLLYKY